MANNQGAVIGIELANITTDPTIVVTVKTMEGEDGFKFEGNFTETTTCKKLYELVGSKFNENSPGLDFNLFLEGSEDPLKNNDTRIIENLTNEKGEIILFLLQVNPAVGNGEGVRIARDTQEHEIGKCSRSYKETCDFIDKNSFPFILLFMGVLFTICYFAIDDNNKKNSSEYESYAPPYNTTLPGGGGPR